MPGRLHPGTFFFTNAEKSIIMIMPNKKNDFGETLYFYNRGYFVYPFLIAVELCKSANSGSYRGVSPFRCFLFGDNWSLRFSVR